MSKVNYCAAYIYDTTSKNSLNLSKETYLRLFWYFIQFLRNISHLHADHLVFSETMGIKCSDLHDLILYKMKDLSDIRNTYHLCTISSLNQRYGGIMDGGSVWEFELGFLHSLTGKYA